MKKTTRLILQLILICLAVATYLVFRFPEQTQNIMRPLFSHTMTQKKTIIHWNKSNYFLQDYISLLWNKNYTVSNELITNPILTYWSGSEVSTTITFSGNSLVDTETDRESWYQSLSISTPDFTYNSIINTYRDQTINYFKLESQELANTGDEVPPIIVLWKWLLEQYKWSWIGVNQSITSIHQWFSENTTNIRFLDVDRKNTFIWIDWESFTFSWTYNHETNLLSWAFQNPLNELEWTIQKIKNDSYELSVTWSGFSFLWEITPLKQGLNRWISIVWTLESPKNWSAPLHWKSVTKKVGRSDLPTPPKEYISRNTILRNLKTLGVFE